MYKSIICHPSIHPSILSSVFHPSIFHLPSISPCTTLHCSLYLPSSRPFILQSFLPTFISPTFTHPPDPPLHPPFLNPRSIYWVDPVYVRWTGPADLHVKRFAERPAQSLWRSQAQRVQIDQVHDVHHRGPVSWRWPTNIVISHTNNTGIQHN